VGIELTLDICRRYDIEPALIFPLFPGGDDRLLLELLRGQVGSLPTGVGVREGGAAGIRLCREEALSHGVYVGVSKR